jgi:hypothetical protein
MEDINAGADLKQFETEIKNKIIADMGFDEASEEQKKELIDNLDERISIAFMKSILANIEESEGNALLDKMEKNEPIDSDLDKIMEKYPELSDKVQSDLEALYEKILAEAKETWQTITQE